MPVRALVVAILLVSTQSLAVRPQIAAGHAFSAALRSDGIVFTWGDWGCGASVVPVQVPGLAGITAIAAGNDHLVALKSDGTVWTLGLTGADGQLGRGAFTGSCTAAAVPGITTATGVAAAAFTTYAVLSNGTIQSWGDSLFGALGAAGGDRASPGPVGSLTGMAAVASGSDAGFAFGLTPGGSVRGWGDDLRWQLGFTIGANTGTSTPGVSTLSGGARRLSAGSYHSAAARTDGSVVTVGWNNNGEWGNGTINGAVDRYQAAVVPGLTGVVELASGQYHNLAVRFDGTVVAWGDGFWGQIGNAAAVDAPSPVTVAVPVEVSQVAGGGFNSLALGTDGSVWSWGYGFYGANGDNTYDDRLVPVRVHGAGNVGFLSLGAAPVAIPALDSDGDGIPDVIEAAEGRNILSKDNDIFTSGTAGNYLFAKQQYRDFLGREGDAAGIRGWTDLLNAGTYSRLQVIDSFLQSQEFAGFVAPVVRLYFATFLRVPDYAGLTFNAGLVKAGTLTVTQLADFFTASPEFAATYGALDNAQFVTLLYANVLGRAPDPAGLSGWVGLLDGGYSRGQVLLGFSDSAEYQAAMANEVLVTMMYAGMLRRTPEPAGFNGWVGGLDSSAYTRTQVINGFFLSTEYHGRFLP